MKKVFYYLQGNIRTFLYYTWGGKLKFLLPLHICEQYEYRMNSIDRKCFMEGQCKICKCSVPELQMSDKPCEKPCYPLFMSKKTWEQAKKHGFILMKETGRLWVVDTQIKRFAYVG